MSDITIRNATLADAPRILEIYAYYVEHTVITFEYDVPSLAEFEGRMRDIMKKYPYLVIERDGRIEGYAYAHAFVGRAAYDWAAELTIYLDHDARRGGLGRVLYEALADRLKAMGVLNLYARIGYPQAEDEYLTKNSAQFHEHLGFTPAGTFHNCGYKVRALVRHDLDGKNHRRAPPRPAGHRAVSILSLYKKAGASAGCTCFCFTVYPSVLCGIAACTADNTGHVRREAAGESLAPGSCRATAR